MTSRDPQSCCEAVRSAILVTAWLLVLLSLTPPNCAEFNDLFEAAFLLLRRGSRNNAHELTLHHVEEYRNSLAPQFCQQSTGKNTITGWNEQTI